MKIILCLYFGLFTLGTFGCDCKSVSKNKQYDTSTFVFLGKVEEVNEIDSYFTLSVYEVFKGQVDTLVKAVIDDCSITPSLGEVWLLYAKRYDDEFVYVTRCGWSRSFSKPFGGSSSNYPPPPNPDAKNSTSQIINILYTNRALSELQFDILNLRNVRLLNSIAQAEQNDLPDARGPNFKYYIILSGIILILIFALLVLAFKPCRMRKKK